MHKTPNRIQLKQEYFSFSRLHIMSGKINSDDIKASEEVLKKNLTKALPLLEKAEIVGLIEPINPYWVQTFSQYILKVFQYQYSILPKKVLIHQYFNTFENQKVLKIPIHQY